MFCSAIYMIHGYYPNMRHEVARNVFRKNLNPIAYEMTRKVLDEQYTGDIGYNPGSQMIQIAGISVLNSLDHYIKERLRIKFYMRYMDDFILIHEDKEFLTKCQALIKQELQKIGFEFNEKKTGIYSIAKGISFIGFKFILTDSGKVIMLIRKENVAHARHKLFKLSKLAKAGKLTREKVDQCYMSWRDHAGKGNSFMLLQRMDKYYKELWKEQTNEDQKEQRYRKGEGA